MARAIDASHFGEIMEQWKKDCLECDDQHGADVIIDVILQLDDMPTLTQPNEPLTLEELSLCNDPVWIRRIGDGDLSDDGWAIVEGPRCLTWHDGIPVSWGIRVWWPGSEDEDCPKYENYGKTWLAYRRPPEEVLRDGKEQ